MENRMEHFEYKEMIQFYLYDELENDKKKLFEEHIKICNECVIELESYKNLFAKVSGDSQSAFDTKLLTETRLELRGLLKAQKIKIPFTIKFKEIINSFLHKPYGLAFSATAILLIGVFVGYLLYNTPSTINEQNVSNINDQLKIQNINFIDSDPSDGSVEFTFDAINPGHIKGKIDDPELQSILTYALLNEQNPGTRLNSINVINAVNSSGMDEEIKQTFISVAKYDQNPGVRREALNALNEIPADEEIKNTLIYVLLNDTSSGIRIEAINNLVRVSNQGISFTKNDLSMIREKMNLDKNNYVRFQAKNILKEY